MWKGFFPDAEQEAGEILKTAEEKAAAVIAAASAVRKKGRRESEAEVREKTSGIFERKAAAARLDSAKILLSEKRRVIDAIYASALKKLVDLNEEECLALTERLLKIMRTRAMNFLCRELFLRPLGGEIARHRREKIENFR